MIGAYKYATDAKARAVINRIFSPSASAGANSKPSPAVGQGCIYCVPGEKTSSGKDYIGSTDNMGEREKDKSDGRDRRGATVVDNYTVGDREERRTKEQQTINDNGGVAELDNRRNEIRESKWDEKGVKPPEPKKPDPEPKK